MVDRRKKLQVLVLVIVALELDLLEAVNKLDEPNSRVIRSDEELAIVDKGHAAYLSSRRESASPVFAVDLGLVV